MFVSTRPLFWYHILELQGDEDKDVFCTKMVIKVTKGQISNGTISQNMCHEEYYLCGKFHSFMKECIKLSILGAMPPCFVYVCGICIMCVNCVHTTNCYIFCSDNSSGHSEEWHCHSHKHGQHLQNHRENCYHILTYIHVAIQHHKSWSLMVIHNVFRQYS